MTRQSKSILLWAIYVLVVVIVLLWVARTIVYGAPQLPGAKKRPRAVAITQGAGAELLISKAATMPPSPPMWRTLIAWDYPTNLWNTVTNFKVYSGPLPGEYTTNTLAGKVLTNLYPWPRRSVSYVAVTAMGANGEESLFSNELRVPPIYTNFVVTVTSTSATNLQWCKAIGQPWNKLGATNYTVTNPPTPRYWRAMGKSRTTPGRVYITSRWQ